MYHGLRSGNEVTDALLNLRRCFDINAENNADKRNY